MTTLAQRLPSWLRYLVVGGFSYLLDVMLMATAWYVLDLPLWVATSVGFWGSFVVNFLLTRYWTFEAGDAPPTGQLMRYGVLVAVNYVVTLVAVGLLHQAGLEAIVARTLVLVVLTGSTYVIYRRWVFAG